MCWVASGVTSEAMLISRISIGRAFGIGALIILGSIKLGADFFIAANAPTQAWDALSHWAVVANEADYFINPWSHRHPPLNAVMMQIGSSLGNWMGLSAGMLWLLPATVVLFAWHHAFGATVNWTILVPFFLLSVPILENHMALWGYAEVWQFCLMSVPCIILSAAEGRLRGSEVIACLTCLLLLSLSKNTGVVLVAYVVISHLTARCLLKTACTRTIFSKMLCLLGVLFILTPVIVSTFHNVSVELLGRAVHLRPSNLQLVADSLLQSLFVNQSLSTAPITVIVITLYLMWQPLTYRSVFFFSMLSSFIVLHLGGLAYISYWIGHATPWNDTLFSRQIFPPALAILTLGLVASVPKPYIAPPQ